MKKSKKINTDSQCYGLAYADWKLFVSDTNYVFVYTMFGEKLQQFCFDGMDTSRLAVSSDKLKIYVSSYYQGLIILDRNRSSIDKFSGPELKGAFDVCLLNSGDVLVCGYASKTCIENLKIERARLIKRTREEEGHSILQFSPDGKLIGKVLKSDKKFEAVCCDKNNTKLIVGFDNDNNIEVYDISGW